MSWTHAQRVAYYHRERRALLIRLGGRCARCGLADLDRLHVHHPNGRPYILAKLGRWARLARWKQEEKAHLLGALCDDCNGWEGGGRRYPEGRSNGTRVGGGGNRHVRRRSLVSGKS